MILLSNDITDDLLVAMTHVIQPQHLLVIALAGWLNCQQQPVNERLSCIV